jgi:hypothetical protein
MVSQKTSSIKARTLRSWRDKMSACIVYFVTGLECIRESGWWLWNGGSSGRGLGKGYLVEDNSE